MLRLKSLMLGPDASKVFGTKEEESNLVLADGTPRMNLILLDEKSSVVTRAPQELLKHEAIDIPSCGAHVPVRQENSKNSKPSACSKCSILSRQEKNVRWTTDKFCKNCHGKDNAKESVSSDRYHDSVYFDILSPGSGALHLRTNIKARFSSPRSLFLTNSKTPTAQAASTQSACSDIDLDQHQSLLVLSQENLEKADSLRTDHYLQAGLLDSQTPRRSFSTCRRASSPSQLPPLHEHIGDIPLIQERESESLFRNYRRAHTDHPTFDNSQSHKKLVVKKTRNPLNVLIGSLEARSRSLVLSSTAGPEIRPGHTFASHRVTSRPVQNPGLLSSLLIPSCTNPRIIDIRHKLSIRSLPSETRDFSVVPAKNQRFLGRHRTPSTPEFLYRSVSLQQGQLKTRSRSLTSVRHYTPPRVTPLFIGISPKTLFVPSKRTRSVVLAVKPSKNTSRASKRIPVLTPSTVFKMAPHATLEACESVTPSPTHLTNGVIDTPPESVAVGADRRGSSNEATHGSFDGGGADAPPNSPPNGVSSPDTTSLAAGVTQGLVNSVRVNGNVNVNVNGNGNGNGAYGHYYHDFMGPYRSRYQRHHIHLPYADEDDPYNIREPMENQDIYFGYNDLDVDESYYNHDQVSNNDSDLIRESVLAAERREEEHHLPDGFYVEDVPHEFAEPFPSTPLRAISDGHSVTGPATPYRGGNSRNGEDQNQSFTQAIQDGAERRSILQETPTHRPQHRASRLTFSQHSADGDLATSAEPSVAVYRAPTFDDLGIAHVEDEMEAPSLLERFGTFLLGCLCLRSRHFGSIEDTEL